MITGYNAQQPVDDFGFRFTPLKYSASLAASTDTSLTVPGGASRYKVIIKVKNAGLVWVAINATAALPVGGTFAATSSELVTDSRTLCREVVANDVLHFITATASTDISVVFYSVGSINS